MAACDHGSPKSQEPNPIGHAALAEKHPSFLCSRTLKDGHVCFRFEQIDGTFGHWVVSTVVVFTRRVVEMGHKFWLSANSISSVLRKVSSRLLRARRSSANVASFVLEKLFLGLRLKRLERDRSAKRTERRPIDLRMPRIAPRWGGQRKLLRVF